jgi:hypothetical protein
VALTVGDAVDSTISSPPASRFGFTYAAAEPIITGDVLLVELKLKTSRRAIRAVRSGGSS